MNDRIHDLAEVTDDYAVTFDLAFALLDKIPAPVAARALLAICDEHEIDWTSEVTDEVALDVKEQVGAPHRHARASERMARGPWRHFASTALFLIRNTSLARHAEPIEGNGRCAHVIIVVFSHRGLMLNTVRVPLWHPIPIAILFG